MTRRRALALAAGLAVIGLGLARLLLHERPPIQTASPPAKPERVKVTRSLMSTWVTVIAYGEDRQATIGAVEAAFERMNALEQQLSRFLPGSDVSRINRAPAGTPVAVGEDTWRALEAARSAWEQSGGVFDVTVGPLMNLWRRAGERGRLPSDEELAEARARVGFGKVKLLPEGHRVVLAEPGMSTDLGGLAKGYVTDQAVEVLRTRGLVSALVEAGGDISTLGRRGDGRPWVTAVRNPEMEDGRPFVTLVAVAGEAVVTSGSYARYVEIGGQRYTHILDPRTGRPETTVSSATVIGSDATSADWLATALTVLGPAKGVELIEALPGYECLIIIGHGPQQQLARSSGFAAYERERP